MGRTSGGRRGNADGILLGARLDRTCQVGMQEQLYRILRDLILGERLQGGTRLPSTRVIAAELGIGRNTAMAAFEQLQAEGYLVSRVGSGTRVCTVLPEAFLEARRAASTGVADPIPHAPRVSTRGRLVETMTGVSAGLTPAFSPGMPALDRFPYAAWSKLLTEEWRGHGAAAGDAGGLWSLRQHVSAYVRAARGINCRADQVIIVSGNREGTELASRVLLDPGDEAIVEEPGYPGIRFALAASGIRAIPLAVDENGLVLSGLTEAHRSARMLCTAPSHQYPLGGTTSLPRRLALLDWAWRSGSWIVEDDYDSEFRYRERPLPSLQSLDRHECVIYVGTFSKTLLPSLRLGYLIVPRALITAFVAMKLASSGPTASVSQRAVSRFIESGMFFRHVRAMRTLYADRRTALIDLVGRYLPELTIPKQEAAGLFLVTALREDVARSTSDVRVAAAARDAGIHVEPLSPLYATLPKVAGLIFGFGGLPEDAMQPSLERLATIIRACSNGRDHLGTRRAEASAKFHCAHNRG